jgi:hypothetical protein
MADGFKPPKRKGFRVVKGGKEPTPKAIRTIDMTREQWRDVYKRHLRNIAMYGYTPREAEGFKKLYGPVEGRRELKRNLEKARRYVGFRNRLIKKFLKVVK